MNQISTDIYSFLEKEEKESAISFILNKLQLKELDILDLYDILTSFLNNYKFNQEDKSISIWKEHVTSAIVRTIVECCYPYVLQKRDDLNLQPKGTAIVLCPPGEYHDLGARMVADYFTIIGYNTIFVGSNTPYQDFYHAIHMIRPAVISISVSNYYNLFAVSKIIETIKQTYPHPVKIVVGGYAFQDDEMNKQNAVGADYYAKTFEDLINFSVREVTL